MTGIPDPKIRVQYLPAIKAAPAHTGDGLPHREYRGNQRIAANILLIIVIGTVYMYMIMIAPFICNRKKSGGCYYPLPGHVRRRKDVEVARNRDGPGKTGKWRLPVEMICGGYEKEIAARTIRFPGIFQETRSNPDILR